MIYVNVIVDNKSKYTDNLFTYKADMNVQVGDLVVVPFGRYNKEKKALVCGTEEADLSEVVTGTETAESSAAASGTETTPPSAAASGTKTTTPSEVAGGNETTQLSEDKIKGVIGVEKAGYLTEEMVKTILWMKQRYGIKYHDAYRCFTVKGKDAKEGKEKEPYSGISGNYSRPQALTGEQQVAVNAITRALESGKQTNFLLHGVTSSGKTQVYMEAIEKTISLGKKAIMLVPEISLTKQVIEVFAGRFGKEKLAVLHSKLTPRERYDEWKRIREGKADVVIGARMGVFAPLSDIGLIVMDEEHETSYKADMTPKYDTVDIAMKRLGYYKGVLLAGSATPSVVSYSRVNQGIYTLLSLKERYNNTPLPQVEIVDMRKELRAGNTTIFSNSLYRQIKEEIEEGRQVILLQNRRGYSNFVSCRNCGNVMRCPECGISLTYHKAGEKLMCHYCGRTFPVPKQCPECDSSYIKHFGIGTEQVEEAINEFFPGVKTDRLDIDALKTRRDLDRILDAFGKGDTKILVGTQLVAKGLDFHNVGLVGIIAADVTLNIPDYRSSERTFQLITQAAGRAGRGDRRGKVVIQTYEPDNYALLASARHDYEAFYNREIQMREFMEYPPFTDLIMVNFTSEDEELAVEWGNRCKRYMENALKQDLKNAGKKETEKDSGKKQGKDTENPPAKRDNFKILAPRMASSFKGKDAVRFYLLIKCPKGERNRYIYYLENFNIILREEKVNCNMDLDVNPYSVY